MCEKRKMKRGSQASRLREARRLRRMHDDTSSSSSSSSESIPPTTLTAPPPPNEKEIQHRMFIQLAFRTIDLMKKNKVIQEKILELKKETSEFLASVMSNPDNRKRCMDQLRLIAKQRQGNAPGTSGTSSTNSGTEGPKMEQVVKIETV